MKVGWRRENRLINNWAAISHPAEEKRTALIGMIRTCEIFRRGKSVIILDQLNRQALFALFVIMRPKFFTS